MSQALAIAVFIAAYGLIATEKVNRVAVALVGAGLVLLLRLVSAADAFQSEEFGIDWNVVFLLLGMMVIVGALHQTGLFEFLAIWSAKRLRGRPVAILVVLVLLTAAASALLDNVTTVLLIAPATVLIAQRLGLTPVPFLIAEAMASNIGGTATLVGDPPNIIIGSRAGLGYIDFLVNLAPIVLVLLLIFLGLAITLFRKALRPHPERVAELMTLNEREAITDRDLMVRTLIVLGLVTVAFVAHGALHYEPSVVALLGAGTLFLVARRDPVSFLKEVDWQTLAFFMGLFVMVGALVKVGVVERLAELMTASVGDNRLAAALVLMWPSAFFSGIVDNIPYVATMAPLVSDVVRSLGGGPSLEVLWWSLALGADLGGNATIVGASANVVIVGIAAKAGYPIRFLEFARYGVVVVLVTLLVSTAYVWLRYFLLA